MPTRGFSLRGATGALRAAVGLQDAPTLRREGAPIPLKPLPRWDNGRDVVLAGDAAGVVAPASGEGIYYAMACGRMAGEAALEFLRSGQPQALLQGHGRLVLQAKQTLPLDIFGAVTTGHMTQYKQACWHTGFTRSGSMQHAAMGYS